MLQISGAVPYCPLIFSVAVIFCVILWNNIDNLKRHLVQAPILNNHHYEEFQLSSVKSFSSYPTRLQFLLILAYLAINVAFVGIEVQPPHNRWDQLAAVVRDRLGVLATVNMIPLFLLAFRNNPLVYLLGIPFDTYILMHRWLGRIVAIEALGHTIAHLAQHGFAQTSLKLMISPSSPFVFWGFIATMSCLLLCALAWGPLRHAFYETFKQSHVCLSILSIYSLWSHLRIGKLPQLKIIYAIIALWAAEHISRTVRLIYVNARRPSANALVESLPGDACRLSVHLLPSWDIQPGQYTYLYIPFISFWESHPFSVAWTNETHYVSDKSGTQISFVVKAKTGMTRRLYERSVAAGGSFTTTCWLEGPYGCPRSLGSYGTVVLIAGGVGITQHLLQVKSLIHGYNNDTVATRKILLIWSIRHRKHREWVKCWADEISSLREGSDVFQILVYISQPPPLSGVPWSGFTGRPDLESLIANEQKYQIGTMVVSVCGPAQLSDSVRDAVRKLRGNNSIDLIECAFSW
ncbi:unnamed protein product [Clonostachys chloroleuca]|uniref:ferric-chelate reductase (NADPH) n=1 Tax=Clonostachys chloroleuca TaxID=1926264 RepID=A0AA35M6I8_9HYPO|nr:unnamed protein product [Clonostachys chloroleuca]CAI6089246.1 unnamed protein product [Clonostachys chloroleuca]CAI6091348.1 unnamed protein product [Clonostachys chloroleuca]